MNYINGKSHKSIASEEMTTHRSLSLSARFTMADYSRIKSNTYAMRLIGKIDRDSIESNQI